MANINKGEVSVSVDEKTYTLVFSANGMCEVEDHLKRPWLDIALEIDGWREGFPKDGKPSVEQIIGMGRRVKTSLLRALIWGALREHHDEMSIKDAGRLMDRLDPATGGALGLVADLFRRSSPDDAGGGGNPPKPDSQNAAPAAGTGPAS